MTLYQLINEYGKEKINTLTKYPSILTLHQLGEKGVLTDDLTTDIEGETLYATEKIDGTNVRLVCYGHEFLIGSRKEILHYSGDLYWSESMGIVDTIFDLKVPFMKANKLMVIYGELFGGKITAKSKNYGKDKHGFRVFDIVVFDDEQKLIDLLQSDLSTISRWREHQEGTSLKYGQNFLDIDTLKEFPYNLAPSVEFNLDSFDHETVLKAMEESIPETKVALSESAQMKPEGLILRTHDRSKIVKIRFEDYYRTLKNNK